jgi:hypothetical protein
MRKVLLVCAAVGCLAGLFFQTPQQRFTAATLGAGLPIAAYFLTKLLWMATLWARRRNWLQFSLRGLLAFFIVCAVALGFWNYFLRGLQEQLHFRAVVNGLGGSSRNNYMALSEVRISLAGPQITDDVLASLAAMPGRRYVTQIHLGRSAYTGRLSITDAGMVHLTKFPKLSVLLVTECQITDKGLEELKAVPSLKALHVNGCPNITDDGVSWLAERRGLKVLNLMDTGVTPAKMRELEARLPYCYLVQNRP